MTHRKISSDGFDADMKKCLWQHRVLMNFLKCLQLSMKMVYLHKFYDTSSSFRMKCWKMVKIIKDDVRGIAAAFTHPQMS